MANVQPAGRIPSELAAAVEMITAEIDRLAVQIAKDVPINETTERHYYRLDGRIDGLVMAQSLMIRAAVVSRRNDIS